MSSVQSMRRFVCDRLTAAAQEILGAYEKKIEGYEAEIARQCRLLDAELTPELQLQLHRTELPLRNDHKQEEEEFLVIQPQHFDQATNSSQVPLDPPPIKEEQEETCISQETKQLEQQENEASKSTCEQPFNSDHSQPSVPHQTESAANKDPQSSISNKDILPRSDKDTSAVSPPTTGHQLPSHNSIESQDHVTCNHGYTKPRTYIESSQNEITKDQNPTSATGTQKTSNRKCDDKNTAATSSTELATHEEHINDKPTSSGNNEPMPKKSPDTGKATSATSTASTLQRKGAHSLD
ncbi:uncharacterized protein LOC134873470 isoform X2 [Eleginops maclovinus]|uniref:uncharacterized protein LOC134873470 isoform X2 n=1 Tax=Eleginops maclovinus TaxID=56733 RepID=UPI003080541B